MHMCEGWTLVTSVKILEMSDQPELSTRISYKRQNHLHSLERCRGIVMIVKLLFIPRLCFTPTILHFRDTYMLLSSHVSSSKQRHSVLFLLFLFLVAIYFISRCYLLFLVASVPVLLLQRSHRYSSHTRSIEFLLHSTSTRRNYIQIICRIFVHLSLHQLPIRTAFVFMTIYCLFQHHLGVEFQKILRRVFIYF